MSENVLEVETIIWLWSCTLGENLVVGVGIQVFRCKAAAAALNQRPTACHRANRQELKKTEKDPGFHLSSLTGNSRSTVHPEDE